MSVPDISLSAKDEVVRAKQQLGVVGRARFVAAGLLMHAGMALIPPDVKDVLDDLEVRAPDEEE